MRKWLRVFVMEDNNSKVTLDQLRASNHVRHVNEKELKVKFEREDI